MNNNLITTTYAKEHLISVMKELDNSSTKCEINNIVENLVKKITASEYSSLWVYDSTKAVLYRERGDKTPREISVETKKGVLYSCFATKKSIVTNYLASEKNYVSEIDNPDNIRIKSKIMIPLINEGVFLGIVTAYSSVAQKKKFDRNDMELLHSTTPFIINAVEKIKNYSFEDRRKNNANRENFSRRNSGASESIKQLEQIEEQREKVQTSQEVLDFVANIVHDIRTPSNGLFGFLDVLEEQIEDKRLKQYLSHAKESAQLISDLITSILDGVSTRREVSKSKKELVSPFKFFADIANIFSATMFQKQISYNIYIDPLFPKEIEIESIKLKRVIMNLIGNANKFTGNNETIEFFVRYKQQDKKIYIAVKDSGIGIAKARQEEIFEAFKQAEDNTNLQYGGTGLGLAICASYVKEMGGKLDVDSELDKGSIFYFELPIEVKDAELKFTPIDNKEIEIAILMQENNNQVANHISKYLINMGVEKRVTSFSLKKVPSSVTHIIVFEDMLSLEIFEYVKRNQLKMLVVEENFLNLTKQNLDGAALISQYEYFAENLYAFIDEKKIPKVLVVDDDKVSIQLIKVMLEDELCDVDVAYNGKDGLEFLENSIKTNQPYSLVYSDTNMPIMSGAEMLQAYLEYAKRKNVEKIFTVSISGDLYKKHDNEKFDIYIGKPFQKEDIISAFYKSIQKKSV